MSSRPIGADPTARVIARDPAVRRSVEPQSPQPIDRSKPHEEVQIATELAVRTSRVAPPRAELRIDPPHIAEPLHTLVAGGMSDKDARALVHMGTAPTQAAVLLRALLEKPLSMASFAPRRAAVTLLLSIAAGSEAVSGRDFRAMHRRLEGHVIVRPDGYVAELDTGRTIRRAGDVKIDAERGATAGGFAVGRIYEAQGDFLFEVGERPSIERYAGKLPNEASDAHHVMMGVGKAAHGFVLSIGHMVAHPIDTLASLPDALVGIGNLIASSPELAEHFLALPRGEQIEVLAEIVANVALIAGTGGVAAGGARAGAAAIRGGTVSFGLGSGALGEALAASFTLQLELDFAAVAVGSIQLVGGGGALAAQGIMLAEKLGETGPHSSLPPIDNVATASMKRLKRALPSDVWKTKDAALPRIEAARQKVIGQLDELLARTDLGDRTRSALKRARNAIDDHATPADLTGALRDNVGMPVREAGTGQEFAHRGEVNEALQALESARESLGFEFRRRPRQASVETIFSSAGDGVSDLMRAIAAFMRPQ